jgi:hypothetical protein
MDKHFHQPTVENKFSTRCNNFLKTAPKGKRANQKGRTARFGAQKAI